MKYIKCPKCGWPNYRSKCKESFLCIKCDHYIDAECPGSFGLCNALKVYDG